MHAVHSGSTGKVSPKLRHVRAVLVVNPNASSNRETGRDVLARALSSELKLEVVHTQHRGHAAEIARAAVADGAGLVIAHGGDGTVNEVVNGMLSELPPGDSALPALGVIPGGLANVFARALGLPRDPVAATSTLLQAVTSRRLRRIGLGKADDHWFTFNAGVGWDADVVAAVARLRAEGREVSPTLYARTTLACYVRYMRRAPQVTVEVPDEDPVHGLHTAFISNTDPWTYLGAHALRMNPETTFDTGLGVFSLRDMKPHVVWRYVGQMLLGRAKPQKRTAFRRADVGAVRVTCREPLRVQVDGDNLGKRSRIEFRSVPRALHVAV